MAKKSLTAPLNSLTCEVCYTKVLAAECQPGPVVCPTCGRWLGVALLKKG